MTSCKKAQEVTSSDKKQQVTSRKRRRSSVQRDGGKRKLGAAAASIEPMAEVAQRLDDAANAAGVPTDAKRINVQQEFKRLQKMKMQEEAKPLLVKMKENHDGKLKPKSSILHWLALDKAKA